MRKLLLCMSVLAGLFFAETLPASANAAAGLTAVHVDKSSAAVVTKARWRHGYYGGWGYGRRWWGPGIYIGGWPYYGYGYYPRRYYYDDYYYPSYGYYGYYGYPYRWRHRHWHRAYWGPRYYGHRYYGYRHGYYRRWHRY